MSALPSPRALVEVGLEAAWAAGRAALAHFRAGVSAETKADGTPVSVADREAEDVLRRTILAAFPDHAILGEERGEAAGRVPVRWVVDPIDGTRSFLHGVPLWSVLVGVEVEGEPVAGVIHLPALAETVAAARGEGCTWNGRPCRVTATPRLEDALLVTTSERAGRRRSPAFAGLVERVERVRGWSDAYAYALVATGRADLAVDAAAAEWDLAAVLPVIEEAGGRLTDWRGARTTRGGDVVVSNGALHAATIEALRG